MSSLKFSDKLLVSMFLFDKKPPDKVLNKRYDVSLTNISGILTFMSWLNGLSITINSLNTRAPAYTENETHLGTHRVITLERKDEKHRQLSESGKTSLLCLQSIHKQWAHVSGRGAGGGVPARTKRITKWYLFVLNWDKIFPRMVVYLIFRGSCWEM